MGKHLARLHLHYIVFVRLHARGATMTTTQYSTPLVALDVIALDLETTSLDRRVAKIVQVGAVKLTNGTISERPRLDCLVNPGVQIPPETIAVHGISDAAVAHARPFSEVVQDIEDIVGNTVIVGHTISYDLAVLQREYASLGRPWKQPHALCTHLLGRLAAPTLANHSLERLCEWLQLPLIGRHTAIGDALTTAHIFLGLIPHLREKGIRTLAEAEAASRRLAEADVRHAGGLMASSPDTGEHPSSPIARIDSFPYRHRVRDVMSTPPVFADPHTTVRDGMRILIAQKISSIYIRTPSGELGIVTERDLLRALDERGDAAFDDTIETIMSRPLQTVPADAFVYRAIGRLNRLNFRHLGVSDAHGEIIGAVTTRNLLRHRAAHAIMLGDEIDTASSSAALAAAWAKLPLMARSLVAEDVDPRAVCAVISSEIRELTRRAAELAEAKLVADGRGAPPVPYTVLVLGSAGRGESLLAADQDNAIVYEKGGAKGPEDNWFEALGIEMCRTLDEVGVPLCQGGVMASNRTWRMSVADWKATIDGWLRRSRPEDLLNVDIFFDSVPVHGDIRLGETVWNYAYDKSQRSSEFIILMTEMARQRTPAFTLFGNIRIDEKGRIDLKKAGLLPIFTCARVLAIRHDVRAHATPDRLNGIAEKGIGSEEEIAEIIAAHRIMLGAVLDQQLTDIEHGSPPTSRINPDRLGKSGKRALANALNKVDTIIDLVSEGRI